MKFIQSHQNTNGLRNMIKLVCNTHLSTNHFSLKINVNHTQLLTLANTHLTHFFKQNGNDEWFMAEFPYENFSCGGLSLVFR